MRGGEEEVVRRKWRVIGRRLGEDDEDMRSR